MTMTVTNPQENTRETKWVTEADRQGWGWRAEIT